jgi:hypothetical protein
MNILEASKILEVWKQWSYPFHSLLFSIFMGEIPESLLPYPKQLLAEALNTMYKIHLNSGNTKYAEAISNTIPFLMFYSDDDTAIKKIAQIYAIPDISKSFSESFTHFKNEWVDWINKQGDSPGANLNE